MHLCSAYPDELASHGGTGVSTSKLADAIDARVAAGHGEASELGAKVGLTASQNVGAAALFWQCRAVQNIARTVYPAGIATPSWWRLAPPVPARRVPAAAFRRFRGRHSGLLLRLPP